jgi:hypothetical protein
MVSIINKICRSSDLYFDTHDDIYKKIRIKINVFLEETVINELSLNLWSNEDDPKHWISHTTVQMINGIELEMIKNESS